MRQKTGCKNQCDADQTVGTKTDSGKSKPERKERKQTGTHGAATKGNHILSGMSTTSTSLSTQHLYLTLDLVTQHLYHTSFPLHFRHISPITLRDCSM